MANIENPRSWLMLASIMRVNAVPRQSLAPGVHGDSLHKRWAGCSFDHLVGLGLSMQKHESEGLPDPENANRPPKDRMTFWLAMVIACLLALITVMLLRQWI